MPDISCESFVLPDDSSVLADDSHEISNLIKLLFAAVIKHLSAAFYRWCFKGVSSDCLAGLN